MADLQAHFTLLIICFVVTIFIIKELLKATGAKSRLPPSPFALPIIGHLYLIGLIPHQSFHKLSIKYGPLMHLYLGSVPCVVVSSPEMAKEIFTTNGNASLGRPKTSATSNLSYGGKGFVFAQYGPYWKFMKKIVTSHLLNGPTLNLLLPVRQDEINRLVKSLSQKAKLGETVNVGWELLKMTNNVISRMVLSERCSDEEDDAGKMRKVVTDMAEIMGKFNLSDFIWLCKNLDLQSLGKKSKDMPRRFDALIERIIREHEEKPNEQMDLLNILLNVSKDESMEIKLSRENIKAFIMDLFATGTDADAITIEWALAELINHPDIMKKVVQEIEQVVGKNRLLQESDIPNLPYLQAIVKETMRLHPAGGIIFRRLTQDCIVGGYHIPAETNILINVWAIGKDPTHWENPLKFRPERFEERQVDVRGQHYHFLPFGSGGRICPGATLALAVVQSTLGAMIQCFDWKVGKDGNLTSVDMEEGVGLTIPRANPLVCVPMARLHPTPLFM